jgi:hypothetical protein
LGDLHQAIGREHLEAEPAVKERGVVVGFVDPSEDAR